MMIMAIVMMKSRLLHWTAQLWMSLSYQVKLRIQILLAQ
jgi:hypothetical protein